MHLPEPVKYTETHEWALALKDDEALIGLSKHAISLLGDIVYLELPKAGARVMYKASIGIVESVKAAAELYSPLSGIVVVVNEELVKNPGLLNSADYERACYDKYWLYRIALSNPAEWSTLLSADAYRTLIG